MLWFLLCLSLVSELVFLIFSNFFRSVELSDHLVSLGKTFSAQYYGSDCTSTNIRFRVHL